MAVEVAPKPIVRIIGNNQVVANGATLPAARVVDDVGDYNQWGVRLFSTGAGTLTIEYSLDNLTWRVLAAIAVTANNPVDQVYDKTCRYYAAEFQNTSGGNANVDLSYVKGNLG